MFPVIDNDADIRSSQFPLMKSTFFVIELT